VEWKLRKWRLGDAPSIARFADNEKIANNLRDAFPHPYTLADAERYVSSCLDADESAGFQRVIEVNGEAAGNISIQCGSDVYCKSAELGYWLAEPYWGQGIMTAAIRQICKEAFARYDIVRIYAEPFARNTGSRRALEKAGFALEGVLRQSVCKNGVLGDSCVYALLGAVE
jgi:ribosomal-protein-alanine N-acetyltransferase